MDKNNATSSPSERLFPDEQRDLFDKSYQKKLEEEKNRPVECLGMTLSNDDERRKYFLEKLRATRPLVSAAREARLKGTLEGRNDLTLFCVPPTRLAGPGCRALTQMSENC
jgi:hypothetical protein